MKKLLLLFTIISIFSCNDTEKKSVIKKEKHQRYFSLEQIAELKAQCVEKGDRRAFQNLVDNYGNTPYENY